MANFSPVSRAEISVRLPKQIYLNRRLKLRRKRVSARAEIFRPVVKPGWKFQPGQTRRKTSCNRIQISARAEI